MTHKYANLGMRRVAGVVAAATLTVASLSLAGTAQARTQAQVAPTECMVGGSPLALPPPEVTPAFWMIAINFDTAPSTVAKACVVTRGVGSGMNYQILDACQVVSTTPNKRVGDGIAVFDRRTRLDCSVTLPGITTSPAFLWTHARLQVSAGSVQRSATILNSSAMLVKATISPSPACNVSMNSRYGTFSYNNPVGPMCGVYKHLVSRINNNGGQITGWHTRPDGPFFYGPSTGSSNVTIPQTFNFSIGGVDEDFALDWIVIDPPGGCCGGV